ncbi:hypothetical protein IJI99_00700 [bacterium]|nr:hypothetical protein [bacterium]
MKQGIFQLIYFTYLHNELVIGLCLALAATIICLIKKPTRQLVFFLLGFLMLIFHFEYQKYIVQGLADQTIATLFLEEGHYRGRWLTQVAIYHLVPLLLWLTGWGCVILGLLNVNEEHWQMIKKKGKP